MNWFPAPTVGYCLLASLYCFSPAPVFAVGSQQKAVGRLNPKSKIQNLKFPHSPMNNGLRWRSKRFPVTFLAMVVSIADRRSR